MTQEQKDLLLKDLCARLPYGVKVLTYKLDYFHNPSSIETLYEINKDGYISTVESDTSRPIGKPYLFPLSSMTEEIEDEIYAETGLYDIFENDQIHISEGTNFLDICKLFNILNKYHLDYNGLIPMDLANDATGLNIY